MFSSQILLLNTTDSCIIIIILNFALRFFARLKSFIVILFKKELKRIVVSLFLMQIIYIPNSYLLWLLIHTANSVWVAGPFKDFRRIFRNLPQYRMLRFFSTSLQAQYCYQNILLYNFTYIILKYIIFKMLLYYTNYFFL